MILDHLTLPRWVCIVLLASLTPCGEDMKIRVRNLVAEFMDASTCDTFLLKHLLANLHIIRGKQQTLLAHIKNGLVEPSQAELYFSPNDDASNIFLKRKKDFLKYQR